MLRITVGILLVAALVSGGVVRNVRKFHPDGRIVGGAPTTIDQQPWVVSLEAFGLHNCGASIISNNTLVTAGHCIDGLLSYFYVAVAGSTVLSADSAIRIPIQSAIVHENYTDLGYDVALITLSEELVFSENIQPVALADEELAAGQTVNVSGWGLLHEYDILTPDDLHIVEVETIDRETCAKAYSGVQGATVDESMICAGVTAGGKDACNGDSGGPLTKDGVLYGIVSWGVGCAEPGYPGVYTNVVAVRAWIKEHSGI